MLSLKKAGSLQIIVFLFFGLLFGASVFLISDLPSRALVVVLIGIAFPFIAAIIGDLRRFLMVAIVVAIPLRIDANVRRIFENQAGASSLGISLIDVFVILLLVWWIIELVTKESTKIRFYPQITIPALLYFEACLVTVLWAPRLDLAMLELIMMVKVLLLFFVLANQIRDESDLKLVVWSFIFILAFQAVLGNLQVIFGKNLNLGFLGEYQGSRDEIKELGKMYRVGGTLGHPNRLAMFLELLLPMCMAVSFTSQQRRVRIFGFMIFGAGFVALIMTGSRGGWGGAIAGLFLFFYFLIKTKHLSLKNLIGPAFAVIILITIVGFAFSDILEKRFFGEDYGSAESRIPMFQIAFNVIDAHPIGGVGINNYQVKMKNYMKTVHALKYKSIDRPVHNMYLLITGETGFIGLFSFLTLLVFVLRTCYKTIHMQNTFCSVVSTSVLSGFVGFLLHGLVDKHPPGGYSLFYALLAVAASSYFIARKQEEKMKTQDIKNTGRSAEAVQYSKIKV
ncbi:O-antigen ligase family protein [candidate division KSB1 bacterium]|nr:O-antigen ligase family protein [candidate division KSB1 bacterium]